MTTFVNLFAGPGAGKSTTAAGLFRLLKLAGKRAELVTEYAKDLTYEKAPLDNQLYLLAKQDRRQARLVGQVDYVVTDSPLPLSLAYARGFWQSPEFVALVWSMYRRYNNVVVSVNRTKPYAEYGRNQTEDEARALDNTIRGYTLVAATEQSTGVIHVNGDEHAPQRIMEALGL